MNDIAVVISHCRIAGFRSTFVWIQSREAPVTFQFTKYVLFGAITTIVQLGLFTWLTHSYFPAHDYLVEGGIANDLKQRNSILSNLLAFPVCAVVNYLFNIRYIFTAGRHSPGKEFFLFFGISFLSFVVGLFSGPVMISHGLNPWIAQASLTVSSALVNFVCRKFVIFLR